MNNFTIVPLLITLHHNLETNPKPVDLTSDIFVFDSATSTLPLNKYPFICSNGKINIKPIEILKHNKRVEVFFNFDVFKSYLIESQSDTNEILKYNIDVMLTLLFPISLPVYKKIKYASNPDDVVSFFEALIEIIEPYISIKPNNEMTNLKINGETCAVDGAIVLDTIITNPAYFKAQMFATQYVTSILPAAMTVWRDNYVSLLVDDKDSTYTKDAKTLIIAVLKYANQKPNIKKLQDAINDYRIKYNYKTINLISDKETKKIMGLGYMLTTILTYQQNINNTAENTYGLSGNDFRAKPEFAFRQSGSGFIVETLRQNYYPTRNSTNENITKLFNSNDGIIDILEFYNCILEPFNPKNLVLIDSINIGDGKLDTPKYNINLRISIAEGQITTDMINLLECYYDNAIIGAEFEKKKYKLKYTRPVNLKDLIKKIKELQEKQKQNEQKKQGQPQAQVQQQAQFQQPVQQQNQQQQAPQQVQQQQEDNSIIINYFNKLETKEREPISEKQFVEYVVKKDKDFKKDFIDFLNKVNEYKNKNAYDKDSNGNTYSKLYTLLYKSLKGKLEPEIERIKTELQDTNIPQDRKNKYNIKLKTTEIMLDIVNKINASDEMKKFQFTQKGGKRTRKYRSKKRRQRKTLRRSS